MSIKSFDFGLLLICPINPTQSKAIALPHFLSTPFPLYISLLVRSLALKYRTKLRAPTGLAPYRAIKRAN